MNTALNLDVAHEYSEWLKVRLRTVHRGEATVLTTPFLDPFNDGIRVFVEPHGAELLLHDNGDTLENLQCLGIRIESSERRQALTARALAGCAARMQQGRIEVTATLANLPQRVHYLVTAVARMNDLWMSAAPHRFTDFYETVVEFFDAQNVRYLSNISIPGRTVEHPMDFAIALPRGGERLIKLVGNPTPQTAKIISFTWIDIKDARPNAERVVLVNDTVQPGSLDEEGEENARKISEQTMSILEGYSDAVYRWGGRSGPEFQRLFATAA